MELDLGDLAARFNRNEPPGHVQPERGERASSPVQADFVVPIAPKSKLGCNLAGNPPREPTERNRNRGPVVSAAMTTDSHIRSARASRVAASAILLAVVAACSPAATASPNMSGHPSASVEPSTQPTPTAIAGIQHPTGATDVVLRLESGGGFVPVDFLATNAPIFTLYGDGRVVWRDANAPVPDAIGSVNPLAPFRTVRLTEDAVQDPLEDALGRGGLRDAAATYMGQGADLPTTTFTINANGLSKTVSATPLSIEMQPQGGPVIAALVALNDRLQAFGSLVGESDAYAPTAYRGILMPQDQAFNPPVDWPWTTITPADFKSDGNEFLLQRVLTPDDVAKLNLKGIEGGFMGLTLKSGTKFYTFSLRPLLPDETK